MSKCRKCSEMVPGHSVLCDHCRWPNYPEQDLKLCTRCSETKPAAKFYACKINSDGRSCECKACHNKRDKPPPNPARRIHINVERLNIRERYKVLGLAVIYQAKLDKAQDMTEADLEKWCYIADLPVEKTREAIGL